MAGSWKGLPVVRLRTSMAYWRPQLKRPSGPLTVTFQPFHCLRARYCTTQSVTPFTSWRNCSLYRFQSTPGSHGGSMGPIFAEMSLNAAMAASEDTP